jgi:hypothetical protein
MAFEGYLAESEGLLPFTPDQDLAQPLFHHGLDRRIFPGSYFTDFLEQGILNFYGCFHMAICIIKAI